MALTFLPNGKRTKDLTGDNGRGVKDIVERAKLSPEILELMRRTKRRGDKAIYYKDERYDFTLYIEEGTTI